MTKTKASVVCNHHEDFLTVNDNDFNIYDDTNRYNIDSVIGKNVTEREDRYDKEIRFAGFLNRIQQNAVALHLAAVKREYVGINPDDHYINNYFWFLIRKRIYEEHGFMSKDIDAVMDALRKNVES